MNTGTRVRSALMTIALLLCTAGLAAEEAELVTDRPDFTESAVVVPDGSVQIEAGVTWEYGSDDVDVFGGPELLVRWGLTDRLELRIGVPDWVDVSGAESFSGITDGSLGVKWQLGPSRGGWDFATIAEVSVPVGDDELTSDDWDPGVILIAGKDINERWSFGTQLMAFWPTAGDDRELEWGGTAVLGAGLGERGGTFFELAVTVPEEGSSATTFHHGYTWLVNPTFQLDVHLGAGLNDAAPDFLVGFGLAARF